MITITIDATRHGVLTASQSHTLNRRCDLVELTDKLLREYGLSGRARRQVNLVLIWQCLKKRDRWKWTIHDTCGAGVELTFYAVT